MLICAVQNHCYHFGSADNQWDAPFFWKSSMQNCRCTGNCLCSCRVFFYADWLIWSIVFLPLHIAGLHGNLLACDLLHDMFHQLGVYSDHLWGFMYDGKDVIGLVSPRPPKFRGSAGISHTKSRSVDYKCRNELLMDCRLQLHGSNSSEVDNTFTYVTHRRLGEGYWAIAQPLEFINNLYPLRFDLDIFLNWYTTVWKVLPVPMELPRGNFPLSGDLDFSAAEIFLGHFGNLLLDYDVDLGAFWAVAIVWANLF